MFKCKPFSELIYLFLMLPVVLITACSFSDKTTQRYYQKAETKTYDMIAVPGVPFTEAGWDSTMKARVYWAKHLYDKGIAKNIMFSGSSVYSPYYEGQIMALYAIALGIPEKMYSAKPKRNTVQKTCIMFI